MELLSEDWRDFDGLWKMWGKDRTSLNRTLYRLEAEGKAEKMYSSERRAVMWRTGMVPVEIGSVPSQECARCVRTSEVVNIVRTSSRGKVFSHGDGVAKDFEAGDWLVHYPSTNRIEVWSSSEFEKSPLFGPRLH